MPTTRDIAYLLPAISSEVGELNGHYAKFIRGDIDRETASELMRKEIGDILWNVASIAELMDIPLSAIAQENVDKITDRLRRGVIMGNGDNR